MHLVPASVERSFTRIPNAAREQLFPHTWQRFRSPRDRTATARNSSGNPLPKFCVRLELSGELQESPNNHGSKCILIRVYWWIFHRAVSSPICAGVKRFDRYDSCYDSPQFSNNMQFCYIIHCIFSKVTSESSLLWRYEKWMTFRHLSLF